MPIRIDALTDVPEENFLELIRDYREIDNADIVTAYRDAKGTFTVESTIFDRTVGGGATGIIAVKGKMSNFGGPNDHGVGPNEGLAILDRSDVAANQAFFLPQPADTTGLARCLNPQANYLACRWDYSVTPRSFLKTITVKVTNPANGQSIDARPADWGPNASTGRVADLSPGLAAALSLKTDDICLVEIPTPAGSQLPPANVGIATDVNLKAIDAATFRADMTRQLVVMTTFNNTTYWVTNQIGRQEGGQSLLRRVGSSDAEIVLSDSIVFPIEPSEKIPAMVANELNKAVPRTTTSPEGPRGNPPGPGEDVAAKVFAAAQAFVGQDTSHAPNTDHGNLACAWAVNEVVRRALGKPISADENGNNDTGTDGIFAVLKKHHNRVPSAKAGAIVISPTPPEGNVHGHVGIVGKTAGGAVGATPIFSNSSSASEFSQNYTINSWMARYRNKLHLDVLFYELNRDQF